MRAAIIPPRRCIDSSSREAKGLYKDTVSLLDWSLAPQSVQSDNRAGAPNLLCRCPDPWFILSGPLTWRHRQGFRPAFGLGFFLPAGFSTAALWSSVVPNSCAFESKVGSLLADWAPAHGCRLRFDEEGARRGARVTAQGLWRDHQAAGSREWQGQGRSRHFMASYEKCEFFPDPTRCRTAV
jgi:hypothetical protein